MRIYKIAIDDLIVDFRAVNNDLKHLLEGSLQPQVIFGLVRQDDEVWLLMESAEQGRAERCFFVEAEGKGAAALENDILSHYQGDLLLVGAVELPQEEILLLYKSERR